MDSFWVGSWQHVLFPAGDEGKLPVISQLCFGPLETREYGIKNGNFYFEEHIIEGIGADERILLIIEKEEFLKAVENEIRLCEKYAPQLAKRFSEQFAEICDKLKIGKISL